MKMTEAEEIQAAAAAVGLDLSIDECQRIVRTQKESGLPRDEWVAQNIISGLFENTEGHWEHLFEFVFVTPNEHSEEEIQALGDEVHKAVGEIFKRWDEDGRMA